MTRGFDLTKGASGHAELLYDGKPVPLDRVIPGTVTFGVFAAAVEVGRRAGAPATAMTRRPFPLSTGSLCTPRGPWTAEHSPAAWSIRSTGSRSVPQASSTTTRFRWTTRPCLRINRYSVEREIPNTRAASLAFQFAERSDRSTVALSIAGMARYGM
jgi:hypothetical protein